MESNQTSFSSVYKSCSFEHGKDSFTLNESDCEERCICYFFVAVDKYDHCIRESDRFSNVLGSLTISRPTLGCSERS